MYIVTKYTLYCSLKMKYKITCYTFISFSCHAGWFWPLSPQLKKANQSQCRQTLLPKKAAITADTAFAVMADMAAADTGTEAIVGVDQLLMMRFKYFFRYIFYTLHQLLV